MRLLRVMDKRLTEAPYLAGEEYSIADIACYGWSFADDDFHAPVLGETVAALPGFQRWLKTVGERPAVKKGMAVP